MKIPVEYQVLVGSIIATLLLTLIKAIKDYLKDKDSERQGIAITSIVLGILIVIPFISVVGILLALLSLKIKKNKKLSKVALIINLIALLPWLAVVIFGV